MNRPTAAVAVLLLAACARSEEASLGPLDSNQAQQVETVRPDGGDEEVALGGWREALQDDQRVLEFGPSGAPAAFSLRCDSRRGVLLQRHGLTPSGDVPMMRVTAGSETRQLAVTGTTGSNPLLRAALANSDPLLAALGRATTPIAIRVGDSASLNLPPSPLIAAYAAQCANGEALATLPESNGAAPAGNAAADAGD